mgnify:CR=1 FL=1
MQISNAQHVVDMDGNNTAIVATIDGDEVFVPVSQDNRHYAEIMRQVAAGTLTIEEAD